jgi:hypothetical protein
METPRQALASHILKRPVAEYLAEQRAAGLSWRRVAYELHRDTKGKVDISAQALRKWLPDDHG